MLENLQIYDKVRTVPKNALSEIRAGRLKGKSDINPMWRLKVLTELFGPCGFGWKYVITKQWLEQGGNDEVAAFVNIDLFVKMDGEWSEAIPGTGGSSFVANERNGPYTSDECFKMALTDAISVSCKALGVGADVYWNADAQTKYSRPTNNTNQKPQQAPRAEGDGVKVQKDSLSTEAQQKAIYAIAKNSGVDVPTILEQFGVASAKDLTKKQASEIIGKLQKGA